jgi:hypothetical protein
MYSYENRFFEIGNDAPKLREEIKNLFYNNIKPYFEKNNKVGKNKEGVYFYHICHDCMRDQFNLTYQNMNKVAEACNVNVDWNAIENLTSLTFILMPPGSELVPHITSTQKAFCAFNIPLEGVTEIISYEYNEKTEEISQKHKHRYYNPYFLNVQEAHGVKNETSENRLILKTHILALPYEKMVSSYNSSHLISPFNFEPPWLSKKKNGVLV